MILITLYSQKADWTVDALRQAIGDRPYTEVSVHENANARHYLRLIDRQAPCVVVTAPGEAFPYAKTGDPAQVAEVLAHLDREAAE